MGQKVMGRWRRRGEGGVGGRNAGDFPSGPDVVVSSNVHGKGTDNS